MRINRYWIVPPALAAVLCMGQPHHVAGEQGLVPSEVPPFRIAFSSRMFTDVNENDGKAAVKAWGHSLARERGIRVAPDPQILEGAALVSGLENSECDYVAMTTDDYLTLLSHMDTGRIFAASIGGEMTEEYLLLVNKGSGISDLADLAGRTVLLLDNVRTSLAPYWLDVVLLEEGLPPGDNHFRQVKRVQKPSEAVLPVFFGQVDACLVTRHSLDIISELNPQVGRNLVPLVASPNLLPALSVFRPGFDTTLQRRIISEILSLPDTPSGQQVLNLFQSDSIQEAPQSLLETSRTLLARYELLRTETGATPGVKSQ